MCNIPDEVREALEEVISFGREYYNNDPDLKIAKDWLDSLPTTTHPVPTPTSQEEESIRKPYTNI